MNARKIITAFLFACLPLFSFSQTIFAPEVPIKTLRNTAVFFDFGKYDLRPASIAVLQDLAIEIKDLKKVSIEVTAHTDAIGTNKANDILSQNRADAVKAFLATQGIADSIITAQVYGENVPVADNNSDTGRQANRRATIKVLRAMPTGTYKGRVIDFATKEGIQAEIIFRSKTERDSFTTDVNGEFITKLPLGEIIGFDVYAPCYFFENRMFRVKRVGELEFALPKVEKGAVFPIKNLYFVGNQFVLLPKSEPTLPKLLTFMKRNDCGKIEIAGHINKPNHPLVVPESWDFKLSVNRAKMVYDYLLENGISAERMTYKGYGNSQMTYPTARTEERQAQNRRVEIRVTEDVETALSAEKK
jgi:outer membrane protein OmpA-like peptidoglycan-associated protein